MSYEWIPLGFCLDGSMYSMIQELEGKSRYIVNHSELKLSYLKVCPYGHT